MSYTSIGISACLGIVRTTMDRQGTSGLDSYRELKFDGLRVFGVPVLAPLVSGGSPRTLT